MFRSDEKVFFAGEPVCIACLSYFPLFVASPGQSAGSFPLPSGLDLRDNFFIDRRKRFYDTRPVFAIRDHVVRTYAYKFFCFIHADLNTTTSKRVVRYFTNKTLHEKKGCIFLTGLVLAVSILIYRRKELSLF